MDLTFQNVLTQRYAKVRSRIPPNVQLVAVSKKRTVGEIKALYDLGQRAFGENYPQEYRDKRDRLPDDIEWHFIGHLQSNKVKYLGTRTKLVHGVDSTRLLDALDKRAASEGRVQDVLLQVHIAQEESKHGFSAEEVLQLLANNPSKAWPHIQIRGLMGMATFTDDSAKVRSEFDGLAGLFNRIRAGSEMDQAIFTELSMGMSGDIQEAIAAGSTMVRVGTAIFGERGL